MNALTFPKIDFHTHIYPQKIASKAVAAIGDFYSIQMKNDGTSETLLQNGHSINVTKYVVHSVATTPRQVASINSFIASECEKHPEFIGFATLHPFSDTLEKDIEDAISLGLKGIKIHPDFQHFALDCEESVRMFKAIAGKLPILIHTGDKRYDYSGSKRMARVLDLVPDVTAIGAHLGGYSEWENSRKYLIGRENFYIDTSSTLFALEPTAARDMIREHGTKRTLFGTDYPMWDHKEELERFLKMGLSDEECEDIFLNNAKALLKD